ncbi:unnamed protein product [Rangifer tarandus platyrhynchus]|uniref:Uncharacterized protein n=1 Tax=Rangifer tarandus platyrhynchus TaxID=3082113 RepID=A0AC59Z9C1_RANTA
MLLVMPGCSGAGGTREVSGQELPAPCPLQEEQTSCPDTHQTGLGSLGRLPGDKGQPAARNRILCVLWENVRIENSEFSPSALSQEPALSALWGLGGPRDLRIGCP